MPASAGVANNVIPLTALRRFRPKWVVMSDYEYEDPERLRARQPDHPLLALERELGPDYRVRDIRALPSLFGFTWWRSGIPPHDWRYMMPSIRIYERR